MNTETVAYFAVGIILVVLGALTWKKQKISILHSYQYKNVKDEDRPAYTRIMGIGQIIVGIGFCLSGILRLFTESAFFYAGLASGLIVGFVIMHMAQKKYNGSWFS